MSDETDLRGGGDEQRLTEDNFLGRRKHVEREGDFILVFLEL